MGKLPAEVLARLLERYRLEDERVIVGARIGEDAAVIDMGKRYLVAKTDPITFATDRIGWYAVCINANDLATMGATPRWFLATVLLPEGETDEALAEGIFQEIHQACRDLGISLVGGHTEITYDLNRPVVVGQMLGEVEKDKLVTTGGAQVGDVILLTKGIAIEATAILAREKEAHLKERGYSEAFLERAKGYLFHPGISVLQEALLAPGVVPVHAMHDPTEGGLAMGLWELAQAAKVGLLIEGDEVVVLPECERLCTEFGLDPLGAIASGALIIAVSLEDGDELKRALEREGTPCYLIGEVVPPEQGLRLRRGGRTFDLPLFTEDEIAKVFT
ncbi:MAG: AIR synthase family protein [Anaerolineae bacterium]